MSPAALRKEGSAYDLTLALGILSASGQIKSESIEDYLIMGELSLDGSVLPIKGALPIAIKAKKEAIGIVSSEILTAQTNMSCVQNRPVEKKAIQRVISRSAESLPRSSSSVFVEETPATGLRINLGFQTNIGNILGAFIK